MPKIPKPISDMMDDGRIRLSFSGVAIGWQRFKERQWERMLTKAHERLHKGIKN